MLDSVIFDLDGTLWDVNPTVAVARNQVLKAQGIPYREFTATDVAKTVGLPVDEVYARTFPDLSQEQRDFLKPLVAAEISRILPQQGAILYDGVRDGLTRLRERHPLAIVSNCGKGYIEAFLKWSELGPLFVDHECYGNTKLSKGSNISAVIKRRGFKSPVYIGDTEGDQSAAQEAGVRYIHVNYGFGEPIGPCESFDRFDELVESILRA